MNKPYARSLKFAILVTIFATSMFMINFYIIYAENNNFNEYILKKHKEDLTKFLESKKEQQNIDFDNNLIKAMEKLKNILSSIEQNDIKELTFRIENFLSLKKEIRALKYEDNDNNIFLLGYKNKGDLVEIVKFDSINLLHYKKYQDNIIDKNIKLTLYASNTSINDQVLEFFSFTSVSFIELQNRLVQKTKENIILQIVYFTIVGIIFLLFLIRAIYKFEKELRVTHDLVEQKNLLLTESFKIIDSNVIISQTDKNGIIIDATEQFCKKTGYSKEELIGHSHRIIKNPLNDPQIFKDLWENITQNKNWIGEIAVLTKNQETIWMKNLIFPRFDENGQKIGYTALREDITDKKIIQNLSITDELTGAYNRRRFNEIFELEIKNAHRTGDNIIFAMLDIDNFKLYNDTYGHQAGDNALILVSKCIRNMLKRPKDYFFRLGGEEFGLLLVGADGQNVATFFEEICRRVFELNIVHEKNSNFGVITISLGFVGLEEFRVDGDKIYKMADEALYEAKNSGKNKVVRYENKV